MVDTASTFVLSKSTDMTALFVLIGISLLLAIGFLFLFIVAVQKGQFEDEYTPSVRILLDAYDISKNEKNEIKQ
jgi:cbb3-type cytochrome oxidase maturation protein